MEALLAGVSDADTLAELARGRLRAKLPQLREALEGRVDATHRLLLRHILDHITYLEGEIEKLFTEIETLLSPYERQLTLLTGIVGVGRASAVAHPGGNRHRHEPLSFRQTSGLLGRRRAGQ